MSSKHSQMVIILGVEILACFESLQPNAHGKWGPNWALNIPLKLMKDRYWKWTCILNLKLWARNYGKKSG